MRLNRTSDGHEVQLPRIDVDHPALPLYNLARTIPAPGGRAHQVQPRETLRSIARRFYGSETAWHLLAAANQAVLGPDGIVRPGQVLSVPYP